MLMRWINIEQCLTIRYLPHLINEILYKVNSEQLTHKHYEHVLVLTMAWRRMFFDQKKNERHFSERRDNELCAK